MNGIRKGNIIVVDRSINPKLNELVIVTHGNQFRIVTYDGVIEYWGRISWILKKQ